MSAFWMSVARGIIHRYREARVSLMGKRTSWRNVGRGVKMLIDPNDFMDRSFWLGTYEPALILFLSRFLKKGDVCLDIGSQKGFVAFQMGRIVGEEGRVLAFEPDPRAFRYLQEHCDRNRFSNVSVFPYVLGDQDSECQFSLTSQLGWSSRFLNPVARAAAVEQVRTRVRALDRLVESSELLIDTAKLAFVKIDVEGSEQLVLSGMRNLLTKSSPVIWVEINLESLRAGGFSASDVNAELARLGYSLYIPRLERRLAGSRLSFKRLPEIQSVRESVDLAALKFGSPLIRRVQSSGLLSS
jgi:FkbM family methyltransferase